ncbi:MAG: hypothetical protein ACK5M1_07155 [Xanthomarina gelatinilytica]|uniref:hypothetical protein n=1 Tax=Xanthomarina gelatinilytica TaxID=1137281 RepID=UPI003A88DDBD
MNIRIFIILISFLTIGMTSCSPDDGPMTDNAQATETSTPTDPPSEGAGEEDELEPNG